MLVVASTCHHHGMPPPPPLGCQGVIFTKWTPDKHHRHIVKNATHLDPLPVPAVKGFTGTLDQDLVPTWHQVLWLGRGVEGTVGLANKDMMDAIFNPMESGVAYTCALHPAFLLRSSPHLAHLPVGDSQVIFWRGPYQLEVNKTGPNDADATVRFPLGGVTPPTRPATAWQLINAVCAWRPLKQAKSGLWSITCPCDVEVAFGLHTWLRAHIACHFRVNFAQISHNPSLESNVLYHEFSTNFARISRHFHMATAQLSQENFNCWSPHPSSFHAERRFKPHTQQHPKKGPAQQRQQQQQRPPPPQTPRGSFFACEHTSNDGRSGDHPGAVGCGGVSCDTITGAGVMWCRSANPPMCVGSLSTTLRRSPPVRAIELLGFECHLWGSSGVQR